MGRASENSINRRRFSAVAILVSSVAVIFAVGLAEAFLRLQDGDAPIIKLSGFEHSDRLSFRFHHRRGPRDGSVEITREPAHIDGPARLIKILLLGDSWIEGGGIGQGFAEFVGSRMPKDVQFELINGGTTSFSPSLMLLQGEYLIAEHQPDLVLVNIDETDLMDETVRYRQTSVFGTNGQLLAVVPDGVHAVQAAGHVALEEQPLYILRLFEKVYFDRVMIPRLRRAIWSQGYSSLPTYEKLLGPQLSLNPYEEYADEIAYFRERLSEMISRLTAATCPDCVLLAHHPHWAQLEGTDGPASVPTYTRVVSEQLQEITSELRVPFYDALPHVSAIYGDDYASYFKWPDDPFSHLTDDGYRRYGSAIGEHFYDRVAATWAAP